MANPIKSLKDSLSQIPTKYRYWTSLGILAALLIALPITLIGLMTGTFELRKRAVTAEPSPVPGLASCGQSCGDDQDCQEGFLCGTPCPPDQVCAQYLRCYNANCPYDEDCICGASPTPIPCGQEGETIPVYPGYQCCLGLEPISTAHPDASGNCPTTPIVGASVCVKDCGDGQCTLGENKCNCPGDCPTPTGLPRPVCQPSSIEPPTGIPPLTVTLHGGGGAGSTPGIDGYQWDFENDGVWETEISFAPVTHVYTEAGVYYPKYRVHSVNGQWSDVCDYAFPIVVSGTETIRIKLKFGGVTSRPLDDSDREVKIYATNLTGGPDLGSASSKETVVVSVDDSGVYHGEITLPNDNFGHRYRLRIKGPKHLQSVFPDVFFQAGGELDLTDAPLKPGDLDQDGKVDINDLQAVKVFSPDPVDIAVGDVNFDGRVSILDRTLVLNTLSVQYDPE